MGEFFERLGRTYLGIIIGASFTGLFGVLTYFPCFHLFNGFFYDRGFNCVYFSFLLLSISGDSKNGTGETATCQKI